MPSNIIVTSKYVGLVGGATKLYACMGRGFMSNVSTSDVWCDAMGCCVNTNGKEYEM